MEYRIVELGQFKLAGYKKESTNHKRQGYKDCPAFWNEILSAGKQEGLLPLIDQEPYGLISASFYNVDPTDARRFDYYIGVATTMEVPEGMVEIEVRSGTWAVVSCTRETLGKTQVKLVSKWKSMNKEYKLMNSGYMTGKMVSGGPDMEVYGQGDEVEIWVPIASMQ